MADKEQDAAIPAENRPENSLAEDAAMADGASTPGDDSNNFGEDAAAAGFEDNFGLGDQQLSAGHIPSVPSSTLKKKAPVRPVTPKHAPDYGDGGPVLSAPPPSAGNFDDIVLSGNSGEASEESEGLNLSVDPEQGEVEQKSMTPEEELFEQFQLLRVPADVCKYAVWFRKYLSGHPDAMKNLESMLCDEASVEAVRLGMKRLELFPSPEFQKIVFFLPYGMATESELADWDEHINRFPEYAKLTNGEYPYYDPPQFFYHHGAVFLDDAVKERLAGGVFFQCGAYCGASLIAMSQYKPSVMYGFEPALSSGMFMKANVERAGLKNVKMFKMCIGDKLGKAAVPDRDKDGKPCRAEVPLVSLDYFKRGRGETGRTAWIQADVGGMSLPVVRGAEQMIKQDKPLITVAMYHNPEEFFEIVPLLHEWVPEYKFMVRRCQCNLRIPYTEITLIAYVP
jgi:FkbM family methyltransferase